MIRPASDCGVAAMKPSYRLLPSVGVKCSSWSFDTVGLFVDRRARSCAATCSNDRWAERAEHQVAAPAAGRAGATVRMVKVPEALRANLTVLTFEEYRAVSWE